MQLQVDAVHQPQRLELVLGQLARQAALHLVAELRHALAHELRIEFVVAVHGSRGLGLRDGSAERQSASDLCGAQPRPSRHETGARRSPARRRGCWDRRRARARGSGWERDSHPSLAHLDQVGLDHEIVRRVVAAAILPAPAPRRASERPRPRRGSRSTRRRSRGTRRCRRRGGWRSAREISVVLLMTRPLRWR